MLLIPPVCWIRQQISYFDANDVVARRDRHHQKTSETYTVLTVAENTALKRFVIIKNSI